MSAATMITVDRIALAPSLGRLAAVELRKCVDTRAGRWLLISIAIVNTAVAGLTLGFAPADEQTFQGFVDGQQLGTWFLLPIVGILVVTSEWSTRSATTTFALVPQRHRVVLAKIAATTVLALLASAATLVIAALATALSGIGTDSSNWALPAAFLAQVTMSHVLNVLVGVAFGLALLSSPLAIVLYFVLPIAVGVVTETVRALHDLTPWVDLNAAILAVTSIGAGGDDWAHLGTAVVLWLALPLALGMARVLRREIA